MGISFSKAESTSDLNGDTNNHHHNGHNGSLRESDIRIDASNSVKFPTKQLPNYHVRQNSIRSKQPLPDAIEVEKQFSKLLASMDLPPDKARLLKNYDLEKKWDMICDQEMVHAKDPPSHYLTKMRTYLDPKASRSHRKRKIVGESTSTQVLRNLEISLRTNNIEWVKDFLNEENQGLDVLIDYLSFRLSMLRNEQRIEEALTESMERMNSSNQAISVNDVEVRPNGYLRPALGQLLDSPTNKRRTRHINKLNMGNTTDDIHVCIMCLRAIMNNKYGFNLMIQHREAINCIALSLIHKSLRTKALVLELLAAICLVKGGHEIILSAFDNFKIVCHEERRFQTLMNYFMKPTDFNIDFMVACMQFVNIVVHSVEDMNYRVHLQYEFTTLGLDDYLEKLRRNESEELQVQISAYLDNVFDVASLMEDSETKTAALERVNELEDDLSRAKDRIEDLEREMLYRIGELDAELATTRAEREHLLQKLASYEDEINNLSQVIKQLEQSSKCRESLALEWEAVSKTLPKGISIADIPKLLEQKSSTNNSPTSNGPSSIAPAPPKAVAAPPPPPPAPPKPPAMPNSTVPPPPMMPGMPPPPPGMPGMPAPPMNNVDMKTLRRPVQTVYKLPTLNWQALKPNQVKGTIFNELDDDKLHKTINFSEFEEKFKIGGSIVNGHDQRDGTMTTMKKPEKLSLLESNRLRNLAILRRKLDKSIEETIISVNNFDLRSCSLENVELLQKMMPTEQEVKLFKQFIADRKDVNLLTDEDKMLLQLSKVERLSAKLSIMSYIANFVDLVHQIGPQIYSVISAANNLKSSKKFREVLEIILAFGNYMNSSKRGPAYGFKLQSLDSLCDTKSNDKRMSLLNYVVATIRDKFPHLLDFDQELSGIDQASQVTLEIVMGDVNELDRGMEAVRKEVMAIKGNAPQNPILKDFLANSEEKLKKMKTQAKNAQEAFKDCVEYFGESPKNTDANSFFTLIVRFVKEFKNCDQENEKRRRLEEAHAKSLIAPTPQITSNGGEPVPLRPRNTNLSKDLLNELSHAVQIQKRKLLDQDQVNHGTFEDLLVQLKSEPYRRADAVRRSHRKHLDSNRYSRTFEEMNF
uniref:CSON009963 protein n=1 Tax=Culicoides sonorensis TaxID=179676 RepID=A0A336LP78_CULSO